MNTRPSNKKDSQINGAEALLKTLLNAGIDTVFSNPGTSEMHFIAGLDSSKEMRAVLTLFEGVATGAADGYSRMADKPAATLLHLGCGLGNGLANLHNARKARSPIINIIGDHATYHVNYNTPLQSDIETVARNVSKWVRTSKNTSDLCNDAAEAIVHAQGKPGNISTLILPADVSWSKGAKPVPPLPLKSTEIVPIERIKEVAKILSTGERCAFILGGKALSESELLSAAKISKLTGAKLYAEVFPARIERGAGLPEIERIAYFSEMASIQLNGFDHIILIDSLLPVSFFAYPGKKSTLVPEGCKTHQLVGLEEDVGKTLNILVEMLGAYKIIPNIQIIDRPKLPSGKLTSHKVCQSIGALLPNNAIISDESQTSGVMLPFYTAKSPKHDLLTLTGGAIGQGLPVALGAAVACPDRPVIALVGDGSAMYTIQALWSMAREKSNVTVIIFNNLSYGILNIELQRVGANKIGDIARSQLNIASPNLDFVQLGRGMGVSSTRVETCEDFNNAFIAALAKDGPNLIEAVIPKTFSGVKLAALPHLLNSFKYMPYPLAKFVKKRIAP